MGILTDNERVCLAQAINERIHQLNISLEMIRYPEQVQDDIQTYLGIAEKLDINL